MVFDDCPVDDRVWNGVHIERSGGLLRVLPVSVRRLWRVRIRSGLRPADGVLLRAGGLGSLLILCAGLLALWFRMLAVHNRVLSVRRSGVRPVCNGKLLGHRPFEHGAGTE